MYDGSMYGLYAYNSSTAHLHGGDVFKIYASSSTVINMYGYDFQYLPGGFSHGWDRLTGHWADESSFDIILENSSNPEGTYAHVALHEVPEPTTLMLVSLGGLALRRKRRG
jgi:hypothetical protein